MTNLNGQNNEKGNQLSEYDNTENLSSTVSTSISQDYTFLLNKQNIPGVSEQESLYFHIGSLPPASELEKYE